MASPTFSDVILNKEVRRLRQRKSKFLNFVNTEYEGELLGKNSVVFVPVMTNITRTSSNITGTANNTLGTWPGQAIANSSSTFALEPMSLSKYSPYREELTEFQMKHSKIGLEMEIAKNLAASEDVLLDAFVRDLVLVDLIGTIPAANKINSASPVTLTIGNVIGEFAKMVTALDNQEAAEEGRVLFISPAVSELFFQANLFANTDAGLAQIQSGYMGTYQGVAIVKTTSLTASKEMIMMVDKSINIARDYYSLETRNGTDGKYMNLITELVYGGTIFTTNAVNIVVNYVA